MATPHKMYPDLPMVSPLVGFKRKAGSGVVISEDKENLFSATKKYKVYIIIFKVLYQWEKFRFLSYYGIID